MLEGTQTGQALWEVLFQARGALEQIPPESDAGRITGVLLEELERVLGALDPALPRVAPTPAWSIRVGPVAVPVEGWFGTVLASLRDGLVLVDEAGRVMAFNLAAERVCEHTRDAALGRPLSEVIAASTLRAAPRTRPRIATTYFAA